MAWGGVGAQMLVLLLALVAGHALDTHTNPMVAMVAGPVLFVFTKLNILLMVVALLPLGPFDGHSAWAVIPWLRKSIRKRRQLAREMKFFPERTLPPEKRRELEESSTRAATDLMDKLSKNSPDRKEDV